MIEIFRNSSGEDGFTIQELLVTLVIGSIVVTLGFSLLNFVFRTYHTWNNNAAVEDNSSFALSQLIFDLRSANRVLETTDSSMSLIMKSSDTIFYRFTSDLVTRNGLRLVPEDAGALTVKVRSGNSNDLAREKRQSYKIYVSLRRNEYESVLDTEVSLEGDGRSSFEDSLE